MEDVENERLLFVFDKVLLLNPFQQIVKMDEIGEEVFSRYFER